MKQKNVCTKTETDSQIQRECTSGYQWAEGKGEGQDRNIVLRDTNYDV